MGDRKPAEVFPPGDFIKEELAERGWTQDDLGEILGRPTRLVNELISGKRGITPETAKGLGEAFGTSAQVWMNLEATYRLSQVNVQSEAVAKRASIFALAPVRAMVKRGWIPGSKEVSVLEKQVCAFFGIDTLQERPKFFPHAARKSTPYSDLTPVQNAWLFRAWQIADMMQLPAYDSANLNGVFKTVKSLLGDIHGVSEVPKSLNDAGIRLVFVEPLPQSKMDGVTFWINDNPVIALSLRYDRIDWFWYTLLHELAHVKYEDGRNNQNFALDSNLMEEQNRNARPAYEIRADDFASNFLIPQNKFEQFLDDARPRFTKRNICAFAESIGVHPGIVLGQIHHREHNYYLSRELLVKVRDILTRQTTTDGWGIQINTN